jgi:hypothetical protein
MRDVHAKETARKETRPWMDSIGGCNVPPTSCGLSISRPYSRPAAPAQLSETDRKGNTTNEV